MVPEVFPNWPCQPTLGGYKMSFVYSPLLGSESRLSCGVTKDLVRRVQEHDDGIGCRYTRSRGPVRLAWSAGTLTKSEAYKQEYRIKRMSKTDKEALVTEGARLGFSD